ncbi:MAG TPA: GntR family transcriptional regulator [Chthoniobacteraceae bacterium]|nr:GntR family transcriptional regulator [Chthoniobacteraceae bacterium]
MNPSSLSEVQETILNLLQSGRWKPGEKLPSTHDFAEQIGLRSQEVQYALSALAARGYLERKQGVGTILRKRRRSSNAMMFVGTNLHREKAYSGRLLVDTIRTELQQRGYGLTTLDNLFTAHNQEWQHYSATMEGIRRQIETVDPVGYFEVNCFLTSFPELYAPLRRRPAVRQALAEHESDISTDNRHLVNTALEHFAANGRRKIAILRPRSEVNPFFNYDRFLWSRLQELGFLHCQIREIHSGREGVENMAYQLTSALVGEWKNLRKNYVPNCLLVTDDIAMLGVAAALLKSHLDVPRDLEIICKANEDIPHHFGLPVHRYEISQKTIATQMVDLFEARVGKYPGPPTPIAIPGCLRLYENPKG